MELILDIDNYNKKRDKISSNVKLENINKLYNIVSMGIQNFDFHLNHDI